MTILKDVLPHLVIRRYQKPHNPRPVREDPTGVRVRHIVQLPRTRQHMAPYRLRDVPHPLVVVQYPRHRADGHTSQLRHIPYRVLTQNAPPASRHRKIFLPRLVRKRVSICLGNITPIVPSVKGRWGRLTALGGIGPPCLAPRNRGSERQDAAARSVKSQ